jgi:hypothetical protein
MSFFRPILQILCSIVLLILIHLCVHQHNRSISIVNLYTYVSIKSFWSMFLRTMVLFISTKFDTRLMDYSNLPFATKSYGLALTTSFVLRSSNEFDIFPRPLDVCCSFASSLVLQLHFDSSFL